MERSKSSLINPWTPSSDLRTHFLVARHMDTRHSALCVGWFDVAESIIEGCDLRDTRLETLPGKKRQKEESARLRWGLLQQRRRSVAIPLVFVGDPPCRKALTGVL